MRRVAIFSNNPTLIKLWSHALISHFDIFTASSTADLSDAAAVVIDSTNVDNDSDLTAMFAVSSARFLVVGKDWSENKQINALVHGAAGYCGESEPPKLLLQAVTSVLKGDIWIQRHLVPRVIGTLVKMKPIPAEETVDSNKTIESSALLATLSSRENDVANMIRDGESNKVIATSLEISERTVKAHLTSIFKKLAVSDRLHLALYIKEYS
ncbi:MAG: helix-turn-helix transcriptional regulator [Cycloclasticus sp. symbiont of Bathymodiolus heckerae]|nr:MAG: helix-turn-helix transcriptional regulator [Cycloclasticus sp. symbiont of Bathymodiolus heckerae]